MHVVGCRTDPANSDDVALSVIEFANTNPVTHAIYARQPVTFDSELGCAGGGPASNDVKYRCRFLFDEATDLARGQVLLSTASGGGGEEVALYVENADLTRLELEGQAPAPQVASVVINSNLGDPADIDDPGDPWVDRSVAISMPGAGLSGIRVRGTVYDQIDVAQIGLLSFADIDQDNLYIPMHEQEAPPDKDPVVDLTSVQFVRADQMIFDHLPPSSPAGPKYFCFGISQTPRTDGFEACYSLTAEQPQALHFMHICGDNVDPGWQDHFGLTANIDHHQLEPDECDVDLADFGVLAGDLAVSQPGPPAASRCDLDVDGDVDLGDYGLLTMQMTGPVGGFIPAAPPGGEQMMGGGDGGGEPLGGEQAAGAIQQTFDSDEQDTSDPAPPPDEPVDWDQIAAETIAFFSRPDSILESERAMVVEWFRAGAENDPDPDRAAYQRAVADALEQLWSL